MADVESEASAAQKLQFLTDEVLKALYATNDMDLQAYFDAVARNEPVAMTLSVVDDRIRTALHVLGIDTRSRPA